MDNSPTNWLVTGKRSAVHDEGKMAASKTKKAAPATEQKSRRDFIVVATYAMGAVGAGAFAWPLIDQMNPAADTLALASMRWMCQKLLKGSPLH